MYCRNCGNHMADVAAVCIKCGAAAGSGINFCPNCANPTHPQSVACIHCGVALPRVYAPGVQKSKMAAGLLGIFLGGFGVHNFYLGYTGKGVAQLVLTLCTCGAGAIWGFVEGILILAGSINVDADGIPLTN